MTALVAESELQRFSATDSDLPGESEMWELLTAQSSTRLVPIQRRADILLNSRCLVQDQWQLTEDALTQICDELSPGLYQLVANLYGHMPRQGSPREKYSPELAIKALNRLIDFRFDLLQGKEIIVDSRNGRVIGLVSPRYRLLPNLRLAEMALSFVESQPDRTRFHEAILFDRRMLIRFKQEGNVFTLSTPVGKKEPFSAGWHFSNSELGDCCVKGGAVLYRQWSKTVSITPYCNETRLVHRKGHKFEGKLRSLMEAVRSRVTEISNLEPLVSNLAKTPLGLGGSRTEHKDRCGELTTAMTKGGVPKKAADEALAWAAFQSSYKAGSLPAVSSIGKVSDVQLLSLLHQRTAFDLYNAVGYIATTQPPHLQERLEQFAYRFLTKHISVKGINSE